MKLPILSTLLISFILLSTACVKEPAVLHPNRILYNSLCETANGELHVKIDGNTWDNSCAIAYTASLGQSSSDSILLSIVSYTAEGVYLNNGSFEWFSMALFIDQGAGAYQLTEDNSEACYTSGIIEWTSGPDGPDSSLSDEEQYCTDAEKNDNNVVNIESINNERIKGNFNFITYNENNDELNIEGDFDIELTQ